MSCPVKKDTTRKLNCSRAQGKKKLENITSFCGIVENAVEINENCINVITDAKTM